MLGVDGALTILFFLLGGIFPGTDGWKVEYEPGSTPKYFATDVAGWMELVARGGWGLGVMY